MQNETQMEVHGSCHLHGVGQFRPDQVPVVGAQVAAGHCAVGGAFDGQAVLNRNRANPASPLMHDGWGHINRLGKACLRTQLLAGLVNGLLVGHEQNFSIAKVKTQAMLNTHANSIAI